MNHGAISEFYMCVFSSVIVHVQKCVYEKTNAADCLNILKYLSIWAGGLKLGVSEILQCYKTGM